MEEAVVQRSMLLYERSGQTNEQKSYEGGVATSLGDIDQACDVCKPDSIASA